MPKKHPTKIKGYTDVKSAAIDVGKMRYDKLAEFLQELNKEMKRQRRKDIKVGKPKLAKDALQLIYYLDKSCIEAEMLFRKYKKFLKDELED